MQDIDFTFWTLVEATAEILVEFSGISNKVQTGRHCRWQTSYLSYCGNSNEITQHTSSGEIKKKKRSPGIIIKFLSYMYLLLSKTHNF